MGCDVLLQLIIDWALQLAVSQEYLWCNLKCLLCRHLAVKTAYYSWQWNMVAVRLLLLMRWTDDSVIKSLTYIWLTPSRNKPIKKRAVACVLLPKENLESKSLRLTRKKYWVSTVVLESAEKGKDLALANSKSAFQLLRNAWKLAWTEMSKVTLCVEIQQSAQTNPMWSKSCARREKYYDTIC